MAERTLIARVREDEKDPGTLIVASPVVGMADGAPKQGTFLNPFDRVVTVKILNERYTLRLPRDVQGRITETYIPNALTPLAFDDRVVRLDPRAVEPGLAAAGKGGNLAGGPGEAGEAGTITVSAPSEGIFYRRSSPDSPPYVEIGSRISTGSVLGLVEVMKCFNQITYGGPGLPEKGEIVKIFVEDAAEVQFGQALFRLKPID